MNLEELKVLINDDDKALKLSNELDKLRRKREERWISNLVDSSLPE